MNGEIKVGLFVLVGSVLFGTAVFLLGDYSFQRYYSIKAEFSDVAGLPEKGAVKLSGVEVGKIKRIYIDGEKVVVDLAILDGVKIYRDSRFLVGATSMIGSKFMEVDQGHAAAGVIEAGSTVRGENVMPLDRALSHAVDSLQQLIGDIRGQGKLSSDLDAILTNLREVTANVNELVANGQPHAEKAMERLDGITAKLDSILDKTDSIVDKVNRGDGVAGALVSDPKMKSDVSSAITNLKDASASVKETLGRMNGFRTYLKWDFKYEPLAQSSKSDFGVKIYPRAGRYYYLGGANMLNTNDIAKGTDYETMNTIDAQLGWEVGEFDLYAGVVRGTGGSGVRWRPFMNSKWDRVELLAEGSEFTRNRRIKGRYFNDPRLDAGVNFKLNQYVSAGVRLNDMLEVKRVDYTTRVMFEDKDIASLLGFATLGSLKK